MSSTIAAPADADAVGYSMDPPLLLNQAQKLFDASSKASWGLPSSFGAERMEKSSGCTTNHFLANARHGARHLLRGAAESQDIRIGKRRESNRDKSHPGALAPLRRLRQTPGDSWRSAKTARILLGNSYRR